MILPRGISLSRSERSVIEDTHATGSCGNASVLGVHLPPGPCCLPQPDKAVAEARAVIGTKRVAARNVGGHLPRRYGDKAVLE